MINIIIIQTKLILPILILIQLYLKMSEEINLDIIK